MQGFTEQRVPHENLGAAPSVSEVASRCITTAGSAHAADPDSVKAGILKMLATQLLHWFRTQRRTTDATAIGEMLGMDDFQEQQLWAFLAADPARSSAHKKLSELLSSSLVHDIVVGSIRQGNHAPASDPAGSLS